MWAMLDGQLMGEPWSGNFPNWGMMRSGELIPLSKPEPLITGGDGGSWHIPTPSVSDVYIGNLMSSQQSPDKMHSVSLPNFVERYPHGFRHGPTLDVQVAQYPTPISSDATGSRSSKGSARPDEGGLLHAVKAKQWPTPATSQDYKPVRPLAPSEDIGTHGTMLVGAVGDEDPSAIGSVLSADWVEWLMGIPQGWTDIDRKADYHSWLAAAAGPERLHWVKEDGLPRTVTNQKNRVSRLKMLGNGIVPGTAALAIKELSARLL